MSTQGSIDAPRRRGAKLVRKARKLIGGDPNGFLKSCCGVIHVGANLGQERDLYAKHDLKVAWVEPIPEVFARLRENIVDYPDQIAIQSLITDRDGETVTLHVANNGGESSSILDLHEHKDIWPSVHYVEDIELATETLITALGKAEAAFDDYDALVLDTQGTELTVLKGAEKILPCIDYIKTEASDFEAYRGCTTVVEIETYLGRRGFTLIRRDKFAERSAGGAYYNVLFQRDR